MEDEVICLSSDSSRPCSPNIDVSDLFNNSEEPNNHIDSINKHSHKNIPCDKSFGKESLQNRSGSITCSPSKGRVYHDLSDSDNSGNEGFAMFNQNAFNSSDKNFEDQLRLKASAKPLTNSNINKNLKRKGRDLENVKLTKEQRLEEKHRKQAEKERKKAERLAAQQMKPGNCMKYMTVSLDSSLVNCSFGGALLAAIQNSECKHDVSTHSIPSSITWTRHLPDSTHQDENDIVLIWPWQNVIPLIKNHTLCPQIQDMMILNPGKSITLTVFGLNGYYSYLKTKGKSKKTARGDQEYPYLTRTQIEEELIELQIMQNCNHRMIESAEELGQFIVQVTKAIAEIPFKREREKREQEKLEWFAAGDNRDCVAVDAAGNGLLRLWQQQLCQFNLAGHDTAQAIAAVYPSPGAIMRAYDKCTSQKEGEDLLKDIPVRRCQGPLSTSRRIGPELSKKVYMFFNSINGDTPLSQ